MTTKNLRCFDYDTRDHNCEADLELDVRQFGRLFFELCEEFEQKVQDLIEL